MCHGTLNAHVDLNPLHLHTKSLGVPASLPHANAFPQGTDPITFMPIVTVIWWVSNPQDCTTCHWANPVFVTAHVAG